jgi:3-oxoacyl-[acyl-carrier protein] reductase
MPGSDVLLITGARKGIGRHLAETYLERGHIVAGCSREASDLAHERYRHFALDVADEKEVVAMFAAIRGEFGRLDALLNNAGIGLMNHILLTPASAMTRVLQTNVVGTMLCSREAAKLMRRGERGRIVNFSTVAVPLRLEGETAYASSKAAVNTLTQILARELGELRITVNAVGPSPVRTDLTRGIPDDTMQKLIARQAIPRWAEMSDVVNVIDFFLRPESDLITGQIVYLGGISA